MKFLFTCGGTAGHINPALAVAGRLKELMPDSEFLFLGVEGKMEMNLVPRAGYEIRGLNMTYDSLNGSGRLKIVHIQSIAAFHLAFRLGRGEQKDVVYQLVVLQACYSGLNLFCIHKWNKAINFFHRFNYSYVVVLFVLSNLY